ncbi:alpha/beta hydrolase [Solirubrobacter ginsenosidimutans]|nr:alpha/beta hydrolase [Solirubrobacter ginsenosidimutans]
MAVTLLPGVASAAPSSLRWTPCHADVGPRFECAVAQVPLDYSQPRGATISIALTRLPATGPARRIGSLFLNPGGPGGSGVDYVLGAGPALYTDAVRARFDLVGFDPRGVMRSTPLRCFRSQDEWPQAPPIAFPLTFAEEQQWIATDRAIDRACLLHGGAIRDHMSTANGARDMDVLRSLVGDDKLTYAGVSYGSYLGVTYANLFPGKVRALVVDGVLDPIAWSTGRGFESAFVPFSTRLRSDAGAQATLNEFFRLCDAGGPRCAFAGGAAARFAALARRVRQTPIEIPIDDGTTETINYSTLISITLGAMYDSHQWEDLAGFLALLEGIGAGSRIAATVPRPAVPGPPRYTPPGANTRRGIELDYMNFIEAFPGVACSDSNNPRLYAAWSINGALADAQFGYFGRLWTWASSICAEWPGRDKDRYMGPFNAVTANPVLVVGNRFDPATRYEGALTVRGLLPRSALLTVEGWAHTSLFLSACADETIANYLIAVRTPAPGATCRQDVVPFAG